MAARKVDLFYVEAGGGHKSAATALKAVLDQQSPDWRVRTVNLNHVLASVDWYKKITGKGLEDWYNLLLKKGWTWGIEYPMKLMHGLISLTHGRQVAMLEHFWKQDPPDLAVSLIPHFNRALLAGLRQVSAQTPFVTVLTDFADIPPRVWIEPQDQYLVCGTDKAVEQAFAFGHPREHVFRVSGMILRPTFYGIKPVDRAAERIKLGLRPDLPTALVLFGGEGSAVMVEIARQLRDSGLKIQLILMYGRNQDLGRKLAGIGQGKTPVHMQGFTPDVPYFMQIADFMIGKPGPGSITEALAMKLPVIVECNSWTMPQERYNADWVREQGVGLVVQDFRTGIVGAVRELIEPGRFEEIQRRASSVRNEAVFEIVEILKRLMPVDR
ncbi:MAG: galactosyldiacylglycerol synthase [Acidobacteria bacterium]|nr:galactosyldiacylglycerol synthase [Acidobacteriota bacterium]